MSIHYRAPQIAKVMSNSDKTHSNQLHVWLIESGTNQNNPNNWIWVKNGSGFYGQTAVGNPNATSSAKDSPSSYGTSFVPTVGNYVIVMFINGNPTHGYWIGCAMMDTGQTKSMLGTRGTPEKHPNAADLANNNPGRPVDKDYAAQQIKNGLGNDSVRGEGSSSLHRDTSPVVYGMSTPGGSAITFDDKEGAALIKIKTKSGSQIILSETTGDVYASTKDGNSWIELTNEGNVDVYSSLSVSIHSEQNINLRADNDIKVVCRKFSITANDKIGIDASAGVLVQSEGEIKLQTPNAAIETHQGNIMLVASETRTNQLQAKIVKSPQISGGPLNPLVSHNNVMSDYPDAVQRTPTHEPSSTHKPGGLY